MATCLLIKLSLEFSYEEVLFQLSCHYCRQYQQLEKPRKLFKINISRVLSPISPAPLEPPTANNKQVSPNLRKTCSIWKGQWKAKWIILKQVTQPARSTRHLGQDFKYWLFFNRICFLIDACLIWDSKYVFCLRNMFPNHILSLATNDIPLLLDDYF